MTYRDGFKETADRFSRDTADHVMAVLQDDGLYRHLRFKAPKTSFYWFDLVTWPGFLTFVGDVDPGYVFARVPDMFEFFRARSGWNHATINPGYWQEKIQTGRERLRTYSEAKFRQLLAEHTAHHAEEFGESFTDAVREKILDDDTYDLSEEAGARDALNDFDYLYLGSGGLWQTFRFADTWEWDLSEYDWSYLWCCHAIQWGIDQYDKARTAVAT